MCIIQSFYWTINCISQEKVDLGVWQWKTNVFGHEILVQIGQFEPQTSEIASLFTRRILSTKGSIWSHLTNAFHKTHNKLSLNPKTKSIRSELNELWIFERLMSGPFVAVFNSWTLACAWEVPAGDWGFCPYKSRFVQILLMRAIVHIISFPWTQKWSKSVQNWIIYKFLKMSVHVHVGACISLLPVPAA